MTGLFAVVLVVLHLSLEMVVPIYGDFDHFSLKFIAINLSHALTPFLLSTAQAVHHRAQGRPCGKGGQYQSAGAGAAVLLPLIFLDPFLYHRHAGFMAIHASDTPLPKRRSRQDAKRAHPAHGMTVDAARPLKRRYEILIVRRKKGQTYAAVCLIMRDKTHLSRLILQISIFSTCISAANSAAVLGGGSMAAFLLYRKKRGNTITRFDP